MEDSEVMDALSRMFVSGKRRDLRKGDVIMNSTDEPVLVRVISGYVKRYIINDNGAIKVQSIYAPGYVYPLTMVFNVLFDLNIYEGTETVYYDALTDVKLSIINADMLKHSVKIDPQIYKDLLFEAGQRLHSNIQWLENASLQKSSQRLSHKLVYLANKFGETTPQGTRIKIQLTHQDLADILSMARETVSRHMAQLADKGLIIVGGKIIIPDTEALLQASY